MGLVSDDQMIIIGGSAVYLGVFHPVAGKDPFAHTKFYNAVFVQVNLLGIAGIGTL